MKVYWIEMSGKCVTYDKDIHAKQIRKFLYYEQDGKEILIAGPHTGHGPLIMMIKLAGELSLPMSRPCGAGDARDGRIRGWESKTYIVETPERLRNKIQESLGLLNWNQ